ncbi:MotE family protein [Oricola nitratireducens]|uniref:MotE family protein n=1 Tax=Oricola nitratireducens TaxID=2775868 RepID=UPI001866C5E9|nr:MotE family protein [Oricola nitratireducens]
MIVNHAEKLPAKTALSFAVVIAGLLAAAGPAVAQNHTASLLDSQPPQANADDIERFCTNIADPARERRYAIQKAELQSLRDEIEARIKVLEGKRAELEMWAKRRETFSAAASAGLVDVYSKMRPDAAAKRMEKLPGELSAALLSKLNARTAGTILNEMSADRAAMVTMIMAAAADKQEIRK